MNLASLCGAVHVSTGFRLELERFRIVLRTTGSVASGFHAVVHFRVAERRHKRKEPATYAGGFWPVHVGLRLVSDF